MLGIEDIIKNITVHTGQSRGVSPAELRAVWHSLWSCVERLLAQGKSVTIPNFATISVVPSGSSSSALSFQLHPHFTSTHNVTSPLEMKGPGAGVATAVSLHAAFIEQELGASITRHAVQNSLKDTIRHIGLVAGSGKALRLDCNPVMTLNFLNCRANVSFNGRLTRNLPSPARSATGGNKAQQQQQQQQQRNQGGSSSRASSTASSARRSNAGASSTSRSSSRRVSDAKNYNNVGGGLSYEDYKNQIQQEQQYDQQQQQYDDDHHQESQQQQQYVPRPPSSSTTTSQQRGFNNNNNNTNGLTGTKRVQIQELLASGRGGSGNNQTEAMSASRGTFSQCSSGARAHNREQRMQIARQVADDMHVSDYKKHMIKKNVYRHLRGEVYRNIWERNQQDVSARRQAEAHADKELMEHLEAVAAHEKALLEQRERDRRRTAMETRLLNQRLAPLQKSQQLPRVQDPGEIFYMRSNPLVLQKDTDTLTRQIQDRKAREEREREEDRKIAEEAHEEYLRVKQEAVEARKKRQQTQIQLRAETERIIADKNRRHQEELDHDRHMARNGGLFFEEGGNVFAERSRHIMRENVQLMRQRATQQQREREEAMHNQGTEFRNQLVEDAAQAVAQRQHDHELKEEMRTAWQKQMSEKNARVRAEKRARDTWRDNWRIQNSSSDDDDC